MKPYQRAIASGLLVLLGLTIIGLVLTNRPVSQPASTSAYRAASFWRLARASQEQFETARKLAARAVTREEQWYAREVLRIADNEVDLAFVTAFEEAAQHPAPLTAEARALSDRVKEAQAQVDADQAQIAQRKRALAEAKEIQKDTLKQQLEVMQAQLDLDQDELDDARQDLIRSGGDPQSIIQRMKQRYEAQEQANGGLQNLVPSGAQDSPEATQARNIVAQFRAWYSLRGKDQQLQLAERDARYQVSILNKTHENLDQEASRQKDQRSTPVPELSNTPPQGGKPAGSQTSGEAAKISSLKRRANDRKRMSVYDKRIEDEQQLADTYNKWSTLVQDRERQHLNKLLFCVLWILIIALLTLMADFWVSRSFSKLAADRKQLHTLHSVGNFAAQAGGAVLILLVIFGPPNQFAAVLALAGAGLTVALKDFIVGFIGWFVLMGRHGIRPGDWVEINGVTGEVLEIGPLHTVLLETGSWSDAGHPTGRKVTFVNSFAVEGSYFNFSTSGQWMWDEIQVDIPAGTDPFPVAEAMKQIVAAETQKNAQLARDEWHKVAPGSAPQAFGAEPVMIVRPAGSGATVVIRFITRANERHDVRSRIYRAVIALLRQKDIPQPAPERTPS
jgi:small-conductance mechanosensitive channel